MTKRGHQKFQKGHSKIWAAKFLFRSTKLGSKFPPMYRSVIATVISINSYWIANAPGLLLKKVIKTPGLIKLRQTFRVH